MNDKTNFHTHIETYSDDEIRQAGIDYLVALLHKVSLSTAAVELRIYVPTLSRILDGTLPLQAVKYLTACHIIFMCETNHRLMQILEDIPRGTAYYNSHGERK